MFMDKTKYTVHDVGLTVHDVGFTVHDVGFTVHDFGFTPNIKITIWEFYK